MGGRGSSGSGGGGGSPGEAGYEAKQAEGKDLVAQEFDPSTGPSAFAMENTVAAQGFDGYPSTMSKEQFDAYLAKNPGAVEMYRGFDAQDATQTKQYHESLMSGNFYVQNSGGAVYGSGMYAARVYNAAIGDDISRGRDFSVTRAKQTADGYDGAKVQRMALRPNAKFVDHATIRREFRDLPLSTQKRYNRDVGVYAAAKGYDAIRVGGSNYTVILNRTKLIVDRNY